MIIYQAQLIVDVYNACFNKKQSVTYCTFLEATQYVMELLIGDHPDRRGRAFSFEELTQVIVDYKDFSEEAEDEALDVNDFFGLESKFMEFIVPETSEHCLCPECAEKLQFSYHKAAGS